MRNLIGLMSRFSARQRGSASLQLVTAPRDILLDLCGGDAELYEAMTYALVLKPRERESIDFYLKRAAEAENEGDEILVYANNLIAGQISLFQGSAETAKACFSKCMKFSKETGRVFLPLVEQTDKVLQIAKQYYQGK